MASPIPIILCGKTEQIGRGVIEGLKPEYEVVHFILTPESGIKEIPQVLAGKSPETKGSEIGTGGVGNGAKAIVLGGAFDEGTILSMREVVSKTARVPWLRHDGTKPAPPLGPEYGKAMVLRVKEAMGELQKSGKLDAGVEDVFWY